MAFRTQKISQMTPKGANLEATDLIEVSTIESGSYVTRSITGQEIIDAAVGNVDWGDIGGTLSAQTDLQNALDAKQDDITLTTTGSSGASTLVGSTLNVPNYTLSGLGGVPTSRTLTINGVTQDLSANRTFTISTGITIGSTAIASGTVGRILFEGAGNVVQESSSLFWDNTNGRLGVGTDTPTTIVHINGNTAGTAPSLQIRQQANTTPTWFAVRNTDNLASAGAISLDLGISGGAGQFFTGTAQGDIVLKAYSNGSTSKFFVGATSGSSSNMVLFPSGNTGLNTTTDAGFRLDVNGTARVQTSIQSPSVVAGATNGFGFALWVGNTARMENGINFGAVGTIIHSGTDMFYNNISTGNLIFRTSTNVERFRVFGSTGNLGINTTTDAGFRLDVNGTARVSATDGVSAFQITAPTRAWYFTTSQSGGTFNAISGAANGAAGTGNFGFVINGGWAFNIGLSASQPNSFFSVYPSATNNGEVRIGGQIGNASSLLTLESTTKGFLPPRMTTTQKNAIASPAAGLMVYDTTLNVISYYNGSMWI